MQKVLYGVKAKKLLGALFSSYGTPALPRYWTSRFLCSGHQHFRASLQQERHDQHGHQEKLRQDYSHSEHNRNPSHGQQERHHQKPNHGQPFQHPGYVQQDKNYQTLSFGQQEQHDQSPNRSAKRILEGLDRLDDQVDPSTYASLLELYSSSKSLSDGKLVHDHIITHGLETYGSLGTLLVEMYCKCDAMEDALALFFKMHRPWIASPWNLLMKTLTDQGEGKAALQLFEKMQLEGVLPDKVTYISLVSVCAALVEPNHGVTAHARIVCSEFAEDIILETALINMYAKCGSIADASRLFDCMPERNVITWTTLISAHARRSEGKKTLQLFNQMQQEGQVPNQVTFVNTVSACAGLADLTEGRRTHVLMLGNEYDPDVVVRTAFANMYGKCGSLRDALEILHESPERNSVTWNAIIASFVHCGQSKEALDQFYQMQQDGILPDKVTFVSTIDACASLVSAVHGKWIHACIMGTAFQSDVTLGNALISMYDKCGRLHDAKWTFDEILGKNVVSWNTMITAYAQREHGKEALQLFDQMQQEGLIADRVTLYGYFDACASQNALAQGAQMHACIAGSDMVDLDVFLGTALINMYGKCGSLKYAQKAFDKMPEHNVITWNALVAAYAQHGQGRKALLLFDRMLWEGVIPSEATFVGMLNAFADPASLADGERIHSIILGCGYELDNIVGNALMNMYGKCGNLRSAQTVFDKMSERDVISWTTIIGVYAEHGQGKMALLLFDEMLKIVVPDEVTFLNVLTACNRSGLVDDGNHWFKAMSRDHGIAPKAGHYSCMIDLLGRAGRLDEAESLMKKMPFQPTYTAWMAILGACRYKVDVKRAESAAQHIFESYVQNHQPYVLLSNIYAAAGRGDDATRVMTMMRDRHLVISSRLG